MSIFQKIAGLFRSKKEPSAQSGGLFGIPGQVNVDGSKWYGGLSSSGARVQIDHAALRTNARQAYHDSLQARSLVHRFADMVIDTGLKVEPDPITSALGISEEYAAEWARDVETRFHRWASSKTVSLDGSCNLYQIQRLAQICQQRDGEFFARLHYDGSGISKLRIQVIDADLIRGGSEYTIPGSVAPSKDGIDRDKTGSPVRYWITTRRPNGMIERVPVPTYYTRDRIAMLHVFAPEYAGQTRGYSKIGHCLQEFENLEDFAAAQIKKAIIQSSIALYTKPGDGPPQNPFAGLAHRAGAGPAASRAAVDYSEAAAAAQFTGRVSYDEIQEATITTPGTVGVFGLESGDLKAFENSAPSENYANFTDAYSAYISSSMSMPFEVYMMRFGSNYSASRGALLLFQRVCEIQRGEYVSDFLNPVYEMWLSEEIAAGRIAAPGWRDPMLRSAWLSSTWSGAPMPNIDPLRTAEADQLYATLGAQTLDRIARNLNGSSGASNRRKLAMEYEDLPTPPWGEKTGVKNA